MADQRVKESIDKVHARIALQYKVVCGGICLAPLFDARLKIEEEKKEENREVYRKHDGAPVGKPGGKKKITSCAGVGACRPCASACAWSDLACSQPCDYVFRAQNYIPFSLFQDAEL